MESLFLFFLFYLLFIFAHESPFFFFKNQISLKELNLNFCHETYCHIWHKDFLQTKKKDNVFIFQRSQHFRKEERSRVEQKRGVPQTN